MSGVALAMRHGLSGLFSYELNNHGKGDEHPAYAPVVVWHLYLTTQRLKTYDARRQGDLVGLDVTAIGVGRVVRILSDAGVSAARETAAAAVFGRRHIYWRSPVKLSDARQLMHRQRHQGTVYLADYGRYFSSCKYAFFCRSLTLVKCGRLSQPSWL